MQFERNAQEETDRKAAKAAQEASEMQETGKATMFPSLLDTISSVDPAYWTNMVDLTNLLSPQVQEWNSAHPESSVRLLGKCEYRNPGCSHKDRIAKKILQEAESSGRLQSSSSKKTILVASSGNTGCSVAWIGAVMGYSVTVITNAKCSQEKRKHIQALGATLWMAESLPKQFPDILGQETNYMKQEIVLAEAFPEKYFSINQYDHAHNTRAHYEYTGPEMFEQTKGNITHFVMCASTGGTIMGIGKYLKERNPNVSIVLADPSKSYLSSFFLQQKSKDEGEQSLIAVKNRIEKEGKTLVEGAGKTVLTKLMTENGILTPVDRVIRIEDERAFDVCRKMAMCGFVLGGSSGVNVEAAKILAEESVLTNNVTAGGMTIVTVLCDSGLKYLSKIF